ncbi:MAG: OB-fold nucleic acid binding domain-containing protein [Candidatus Ranarchaeia archaeon]
MSELPNKSEGKLRANPSPFVKLRCASIAQAQMLDTEGRHFQLPDGRTVSRARVLGVVVFIRIFEPEEQEEPAGSLDLERPKRKRYGVMIVDDGTDIVTVKAWGDNVMWLDKVKVGDSVDVFGRLNLYRGEVSIITDLVAKIRDNRTEVLRDLVLLKDELRRGRRPGGPSPRSASSQSEKHSPPFPETLDKPLSLETGTQAAEDKTDTDEIDGPLTHLQTDDKIKAEQDTKEHVELRGKILNAIVVLDIDGTGVTRDAILNFVDRVSSQQLEETLARLIEDGDVYMPRRNVFRKV